MKPARALVCFAGLAIAACGGAPDSEAPPNFVVFLVDDMGWTGTSVQMDPRLPDSKSDFYQTPSLEVIARRGMRFSNAYAAGPNCLPSRVSLLTGKTPARLRATAVKPDLASDGPLKPAPSVKTIVNEELTVAELLGSAGYGTAHVGKWGIHGGGPGAHGFAVVYNPQRANASDDPDPKMIFGVTDRAIDFMREQVESRIPFYLQISHHALHWPPKTLASTVRDYRQRKLGSRHSNAEYAAMTADLDTGVGRVLEAIDELGIADRTYVIFTSDNGASDVMTGSQPLSGAKHTLKEGGIRVPLLISGPRVTPGGVSHVPVAGWDLLPTFVDLAGLRDHLPPTSTEGASSPCSREMAREWWRARPRGSYGTSRTTRPNRALFRNRRFASETSNLSGSTGRTG